MIIKNITEAYNSVSKFFHRTTGLLIFIMLVTGFIIVNIEDIAQKDPIIALDKAFGVIIFIIILLIFSVRFLNINVLLPSETPIWQKY